MGSSKFKRYFQLILIVLAAGSIYPLIYLRSGYQETILSVFNISFEQLNILYTVLGFVFVVGYFPSGLLCDKFSAKKLLFVSMAGTSAGGFWFAQVPSYTSVVLIFAIWGFFAVFTFWSAHMKLVKLISTSDTEGRFFGVLDGGRGLVEAVLASVAVIIFARGLGGAETPESTEAALVGVIYMYSIVMAVVALLVLFFVEDDKKLIEAGGEVAERNKFRAKDLLEVFKNPLVLLMGGVIFCGYFLFWTYFYYGGFLQANVGASAVTVAAVMAAAAWMRPVGGVIGGFLADKAGKGKVISAALIGGALCLILMSVLPTSGPATIFFVLAIVGSLFVFAVRGTYWSILGDCKLDVKVLGAAIGFISLIGYLPDIIIPIIANFLFATFGDYGGYNAYFIASAVIGLCGVLFLAAFWRVAKKAAKAEKS